MNIARIVALAALMGASAAFAQISAPGTPASGVQAPSAAPAALSVDALMAEIRKNWYEPELPGLEEKLREAAARGLLVGLNRIQAERIGGSAPPPPDEDEGVNRLYTPDEFKLFRQEVSGKFGGVGMVLGPPGALEHEHEHGGIPEEGGEPIVVLKLVAGMPGEKAGLKAGDRLVSVDGAPVATAPLKDVVLKLRGEPGSKVAVGVERDGKPIAYQLERAEIRVPAVEYTAREGGTALIAFHEFNDGAVDELKAALVRANTEKLRGLVIDLRDNPGGALDAAYAAAKLVVDRGQVIARTRRHGEGEQVHASDADPVWHGALVVLVNHNTRSSAEVFAGALQDNHKALIVGERTFGKGTAETLLSLDGGYAVKITSLMLYRPGGAATAKGGLVPDVPLAAGHRPPGTFGRPERTPADAGKQPASPDPVDAAFRILSFALPKGP